MSCPRVVKRNRGSGYEKCETPSAPVISLNNDVAARLAERAAQDAKLFPPLQTNPEPPRREQNDGKR